MKEASSQDTSRVLILPDGVPHSACPSGQMEWLWSAFTRCSLCSFSVKLNSFPIHTYICGYSSSCCLLYDLNKLSICLTWIVHYTVVLNAHCAPYCTAVSRDMVIRFASCVCFSLCPADVMATLCSMSAAAQDLWHEGGEFPGHLVGPNFDRWRSPFGLSWQPVRATAVNMHKPEPLFSWCETNDPFSTEHS